MTTLTTPSFDYELVGLDCNAVMVSGDEARATVLVSTAWRVEVTRSSSSVTTSPRSANVARDGMDAGAEMMNELLQDRDALRDRLLGVWTS